MFGKLSKLSRGKSSLDLGSRQAPILLDDDMDGLDLAEFAATVKQETQQPPTEQAQKQGEAMPAAAVQPVEAPVDPLPWQDGQGHDFPETNDEEVCGAPQAVLDFEKQLASQARESHATDELPVKEQELMLEIESGVRKIFKFRKFEIAFFKSLSLSTNLFSCI